MCYAWIPVFKCGTKLCGRLNMKQVSKEQFKEIYFKLGGGKKAGWGSEYWNSFYEKETNHPMKYLVQDQETPQHTRMFIVDDYAANEYRMFFLTEDEEEQIFDFPGKE
jgi:hypothetical protein